MTDYGFTSIDYSPIISKMYQDIDSSYKITSTDIDTSMLGERTLAVWNKLKANFELYYATREIGGQTEYDFFCMIQSCLNRNADTFERQLEVYDDDIAKPILGRTEVVTYNTTDQRDSSSESEVTYGQTTTRTEDGSVIDHHVEVPVNNANYDQDRTRDKTNFDNRTTTDANSGSDSSEVSNEDTRTMTGTVTTELSDIGVRPNYETLNGFLENNKTYIQFFVECFEGCFAPRYGRVFF